jgi:hypothetical protein
LQKRPQISFSLQSQCGESSLKGSKFILSNIVTYQPFLVEIENFQEQIMATTETKPLFGIIGGSNLLQSSYFSSAALKTVDTDYGSQSG